MKSKVRLAFCLFLCLLMVGCQKNDDTKESSNESETMTTITPTQEVTETPTPTQVRGTAYTFDTTTTYQTIDGFGAAYTWYADRLLQKEGVDDAMDDLFTDAKMTIMRFKNEYEYYMEDGASNANTMLKYYIEATNRAAEYGEKVIVLMSCWSPPAYLKEGNDITGVASLRKNEDGSYCYEEYAQWWAESIEYYQAKGIKVDFVSIQNECDFGASYDGCLFASEETSTQASYAKAYLAVYDAFQKKFGEDAPKMIGPETMSCNAGTLSAYMKEIEETKPESIYGIAHHLYVGGESNEDDNSVVPGSFVSNFMNVSSFFNDYKKWQTEFYLGHAIDTATLINNCMTYENTNAYIYWSGVWATENPEFESGQLIACYNSTDTDQGWKLCADYYALRHFSEFVRPGYIRMKANTNDGDVRTSAYMNEYKTKVALVLINTSEEEKEYSISSADYTIIDSCSYQSVFGDTCESADGLYQNIGALGEDGFITLPGKSVTTVDITGYYGDTAPVTPEITKLPTIAVAKPTESVDSSNEKEKNIFSGSYETAEDTMPFEAFGSSCAMHESTGGVDDSGCMRIAGRSADWNGISLGTSRFTTYGYLASVSFDVMMKEAGNTVSCTSTFTKGGNTYYPDGEKCRVVQEITEAGKWYHVEGYVTLYEDMDENSFRIYWESPSNTQDIYLDNVEVKLLLSQPAGNYEK